MSFPLRVQDEADDEFQSAYLWYEAQQTGSGDVFAARVQRVFDLITANPRMHATFYVDVRKSRVPGYPYVVIYRFDGGTVYVLSVFHTSRDPAIWQGRV